LTADTFFGWRIGRKNLGISLHRRTVSNDNKIMDEAAQNATVNDSDRNELVIEGSSFLSKMMLLTRLVQIIIYLP
jgi:hypothetical protein